MTTGLFCEVSDCRFGLLGYLAIDRTLNNKACGGIRWGPKVTPEEIKALAYDMSLKYGFSNIRLGGAKAGIVAPFDLPLEERTARLKAFGRQLGPLLRSRIYIPGADLGTSHDDMLAVKEGAGMVTLDRHHGSQADYYTAYGVFQAVLVALKCVGVSVKQSRVAVEGFGKVGSAIGRLLSQAEARVVAVSTKEGGLFHPEGLKMERLLSLKDSGDISWIKNYKEAQQISPEALYTLPVDVLIPCAGPWMIREDNVEQIQAKAVVPAANIPASRPIQERLEARGILYLPDFMCNCGGILANTLEWRGFDHEQIERFFREVLAAKIERVLRRAKVSHQSPVIAAENLSLENLKRLETLSKRGRRIADPRRVLSYLSSVCYRKPGPLRSLVRNWAWEEAKRAFEEDSTSACV